MTKKVLIYLENIDSSIAKVSKEIISHVNSCFSEVEVNGVLLCDEAMFQSIEQELKSLDLKNIFVIQDNLFDAFNTCIFSDALTRFVTENKPDILLMGATEDGRELAPRVASKLNIGLTADCTDLKQDENGFLLATRPTYGGKMMATIISKTIPNFATIRQGAFKLSSSVSETSAQLVFLKPDITGLKTLIEVIKTENKESSEDWTCSEIIVAGGLGLKTKENFELIYKLAEKLGAKPAASRAAVELGWAPQTIQIGQTGSSVAPKLYIAFGISGAMQHMIGITNADRIIAINIDKNAPIMKSADVAIVNDAVSIIRQLSVV
ncbi:MAG: electron transfer flavoprotein subunit alpha/FixB family protein [Clostridium sp.]|nr:electron transfer flavoprotein subunit alpha/FixB family protein [Clostridium sp.]